MAALYTLPTAWLLVMTGLGILLFLGAAQLYYWAQALHRERRMQRMALEGMNLLLLGMGTLMTYLAMSWREAGVLSLHSGEWICYVITAGALIQGLYCRGREEGGLCVAVAAVLFLPLFEGFMPWVWLLAVALLSIRLFLLLPKARKAYHEEITIYSIQEAVDTLEEGIFLCLENGEPVLINKAMGQAMTDVWGTAFRNGNVLWHLLLQKLPQGISSERQGQNILVRFYDGRRLLFSKEPIFVGKSKNWQITATDVTEISVVNEALALKNEELTRRNEKLKETLQKLVEIQSRETIEDIRFRTHDLIGQRISLLQQILNSKDYKNYDQVGPLLSSTLSDIKKDMSAQAPQLFAELIRTYRDLGIQVKVAGILPSDKKVAGVFVEIIREALTNAICHGNANEISIAFSENERYAMEIKDNGIGCQGPIHKGNGLTAMEKKITALGGTVEVVKGPHFRLTVVV